MRPRYLDTYEAGELGTKVDQAMALMGPPCRVCPRRCEVNRFEGKIGVCGGGLLATVSSFFSHHGEEDCLRGWKGSGTIFFAHCNLRCAFCQNFETSHQGFGEEASHEQLAEMMIALQEAGCHNINFVTPTHVVPQIAEALPLAIRFGLCLPLVYNSSGYDSVETLQILDGLIDIYMPDFKFWEPIVARRLANAEAYPEITRGAIREMHRQVGDLQFDPNGIAIRGLLIRHVVLPKGLAGTREVMSFLANEVSPDTFVNLMDQYVPSGNASDYPEINRRSTLEEYRQAENIARKEGIHRLDSRH